MSSSSWKMVDLLKPVILGHTIEIGPDKTGRPWLIRIIRFTPSQQEVYFEVFSPAFRSEFRKLRLPHVAESILLMEENNTAKLCDLEIMDKSLQNRGIGSFLLRFIHEWATRKGVRKIYGDLSYIDAGHFDKLRHFYEKLGYAFKLYDLSKLKNPDQAVIRGYIEKQLG
jgi:GNAT superfamily N-acetyltransferase